MATITTPVVIVVLAMVNACRLTASSWFGCGGGGGGAAGAGCGGMG